MTSPSYRFVTADLLTQTVLGDISLRNCSASMSWNAYGEFGGSFPLGQSTALDTLNLAITPPGRTALYVQRNAEWMWGGIIWSRDYDSQAGDVTLTAQTFDSYYERVVLERNVIRQNVDQGAIMNTMVTRVNAQDGCNIGIVGSGSTTTGVLRTVLIPYYEFHYASEILQQLIDTDGGIEYVMMIADSATQDHPTRTLTWAAANQLNVGSVINLDYPGNIQAFGWGENAWQGSDKFAGRGGGNGNKAPTAIYEDGTALTAGYPSLWSVYEWPTVATLREVKSKVRGMSVIDDVPICTPSLSVNGDAMVGMWQALGATINFNILDPRFPSGLAGTRRLYGWDATFLDENNAESIRLTTNNGSAS